MLKDKIHIKKANDKILIKHQKKILKLMRESWKLNFPDSKLNENNINDRFQKMIKYIKNNEGSVLIATKKESFIGYLWYFIKNNNSIHINQIIISNEFRGMKIGTRLINTLYEEAKKLDILKVELNVTVSNEKALNFYKKEHFKLKRVLLERDINV